MIALNERSLAKQLQNQLYQQQSNTLEIEKTVQPESLRYSLDLP